ncbi:ABC transporter permease [Mycoplasma iguanae]|uniref:ABC transporter permease n=1 Tax=Mycoplasma iguanae TaxID=292461 RepID=A0ABY5RA78_9MOLU|nr:ABC transporter permease [Mycoplasma iguanae]UVD81684.1 ABC transporter permease [Mycoplasma iguanae]
MTKYFSKRLLLSIVTLFIILFVVYTMQAQFGKNPILISEYDSKVFSQSDIQQKLNEGGFNLPPITRFFNYLGQIFIGNFGATYGNQIEPVRLPETFNSRLKWTLLISVPSFVFSSIIGIFLGILSAYKRGKLLDTSVVSVTTIISGLPSYIIAPIITLLMIQWFNLPVTFQAPDPLRHIGFDITILSVIIPILIFTILSISRYTLIVRNQMIAVLTSNQVLIAKAKGLSQGQIFRKHVFRNASLPLMAALIPSYIDLLSGSIILESYFGIPGSASIFFNSAQFGEIDVIMFNVLFFTGLTLLSKILVDISFAALDPRIKISSSNPNSIFKKVKYLFLRKKNFEKGIINGKTE